MDKKLSNLLMFRLRVLSLYRVDRPWLVYDSVWNFHPKKWEGDRAKKELDLMFIQVISTIYYYS